VHTAFYLWAVSILVSVIGQVLGMPSIDDAVRKAMEGSPAGAAGDVPMSPEAMQSIAKVGMAIGFVVIVGGAALLLYFGFRMRAGRNWARVVIAVLVAINAVFVLFDLKSSSIWQAVALVLAAAAVYFSYRPGTGGYFAARPRPTSTDRRASTDRSSPTE
jgi:hypothetical protein